jgi:hypothetical protein
MFLAANTVYAYLMAASAVANSPLLSITVVALAVRSSLEIWAFTLFSASS